jgi:hypothetical protein
VSDPSGDPADEVTDQGDEAVQNHDQETDPDQPSAPGPEASVLEEGGPSDADASPEGEAPPAVTVEQHDDPSPADRTNGEVPLHRDAAIDDDATVDGAPVLDDPFRTADADAPAGSGDVAAGHGGVPDLAGDPAMAFGGAPPVNGDAPPVNGDAPNTYGDAPVASADAPPLYGDASTYGDAPVHGGSPGYGDAAAYGSAPAYGQGPVQQAVLPPFYDQSQTDGFTPLPPDGPVEPMSESAFAYMDTRAPDQEPLAGPVWPSADGGPGPMLAPAPGVAPPSRGPLLAPSVKRRPVRKGRRVKRVVRRIELWSVLKVSLLVYLCMYLITLTAGVLLWGFAYSAGLIENFESFMNQIGFDDFRFFGDQLFKEAAIIGAVLVVAGALLTVLGVALVNLISEVTGGVRFVVIEIDADEPPSARPS